MTKVRTRADPNVQEVVAYGLTPLETSAPWLACGSKNTTDDTWAPNATLCGSRRDDTRTTPRVADSKRAKCAGDAMRP